MNKFWYFSLLKMEYNSNTSRRFIPSRRIYPSSLNKNERHKEKLNEEISRNSFFLIISILINLIIISASVYFGWKLYEKNIACKFQQNLKYNNTDFASYQQPCKLFKCNPEANLICDSILKICNCDSKTR